MPGTNQTSAYQTKKTQPESAMPELAPKKSSSAGCATSFAESSAECATGALQNQIMVSVLLKLDSALSLKECKGTQTTANSKKDASTQTLGLVSTDRPPDFIYTLFCNGVPADIREKENLTDYLFSLFAAFYPSRRLLSEDWYLVTSPSGQKATFIHLLTEDGAALLTKSVSGKRIAHDSAGLPLKLPFSVSIYPSTKYFKRTFKRFLADTYEQ